jgi:hypothetical protein
MLLRNRLDPAACYESLGKNQPGSYILQLHLRSCGLFASEQAPSQHSALQWVPGA